MTAEEARKISQNSTTNICNDIMRRIKYIAQAGNRECKTYFDEAFVSDKGNVSYVINKFQELGYDVSLRGTELIITW